MIGHLLRLSACFLLLCPAVMAQQLPYNTGFEQNQGFLPGEYSSGPIDTAGGWSVLDGTASVQSLLRFSGTQSLQLQPHALVDSQAGAGATSSLWIQGPVPGPVAGNRPRCQFDGTAQRSAVFS